MKNRIFVFLSVSSFCFLVLQSVVFAQAKWEVPQKVKSDVLKKKYSRVLEFSENQINNPKSSRLNLSFANIPNYHYLIAQTHILQGDFNAATRVYHEIIEKYPYWRNIWFGVDDVRVELNLMTNYLEKEKDSEKKFFMEFYRLVLLNDKRGLEKSLKKMKHSPKRLAQQYARILLIKQALRMGDDDALNQLLFEIQEMSNGEGDFQDVMGYYKLLIHLNLEKSISLELVDDYLNDFPNSIRADDALFLLYGQYKRDSNNELALKTLTRIVEVYPFSDHAPAASFYKAKLLSELSSKQAYVIEAFQACLENYAMTFYGKMSGYFIGHIYFLEDMKESDFRKSEDFYLRLLQQYDNDLQLYSAVEGDLRVIEKHSRKK